MVTSSLFENNINRKQGKKIKNKKMASKFYSIRFRSDSKLTTLETKSRQNPSKIRLCDCSELVNPQATWIMERKLIPIRQRLSDVEVCHKNTINLAHKNCFNFPHLLEI